MNRPSYKELWLDEVKSNAEEMERVRDAVDGNAEVYTDEPYSEGEYLARKIMQLHARIAELEAESERFTVHSDIEWQDDKCSGHGDISNFPPVMGSGDGLGW